MTEETEHTPGSCAMYRTIKPTDTITMWDIRHNTIAGDCAVTVFIQVREAVVLFRISSASGERASTYTFLSVPTSEPGHLDFCHLVGNGPRRHADGQDCRVPLSLGAFLSLSLSTSSSPPSHVPISSSTNTL
jgi:hypothetical protein